MIHFPRVLVLYHFFASYIKVAHLDRTCPDLQEVLREAAKVLGVAEVTSEQWCHEDDGTAEKTVVEAVARLAHTRWQSREAYSRSKMIRKWKEGLTAQIRHQAQKQGRGKTAIAWPAAKIEAAEHGLRVTWRHAD